MDDRIERFVERMGLLWEADGLPRIAGRMFGFLLLQSEPCSLDDMAEALGVSKASVSTDARRLEQLGFIERASRPGDRRDYYAVGPDMLTRVLSVRVKRIEQLEAAFDDVAGAARHPEVRARLEEMQDAHRDLVAAITQLLQKLDRTRPSAAGSR
jgi:DNA-binding transcriptional regulator GbsR (MarR family)